MARDRDDDRFDDEMDDRDDDRRNRTPRCVDAAAARSKVAVPAVFLMLFGFVGLGMGLVSLAVSIAKPNAVGDATADLLKPFVEGQPPSKTRDDQLAEIQAMRNNRQDTPLNLGFTAFGTAVSGLIAAGGLRMKGLKSWGLAVFASVATFYPCSCVFCFAAPFGLWSLIVLMNSDVKAAFAAGGKLPTARDDGGDE